MELDCCQSEKEKDKLQKKVIEIREVVTAQNDVGEAPHHGRYDEKGKEPVSPLPGAAAYGDDQQRDVGKGGHQGKKGIQVHYEVIITSMNEAVKQN